VASKPPVPASPFPTISLEHLVRISEAARILGVAECTVRRGHDEGRIPGVRLGNDRWFDRKTIEQLAAARAAQPTKPGRTTPVRVPR